jgi:hypothetical protein
MRGRIIDAAKFAILSSRFRELSGQTVILCQNVPGFDEYRLTSTLFQALQGAGVRVRWPAERPINSMAGGVQVLATPDPRSELAANKIADALNEMGIFCTNHSDKSFISDPHWHVACWPTGSYDPQGEAVLIAVSDDLPPFFAIEE